MSHQDFADDAIADDFETLLNDFVDYDVQVALVKAIYNCIENNDMESLQTFAKSLHTEINDAALVMTLKDYQDSKMRNCSWGDEADAKRSLQ